MKKRALTILLTLCMLLILRPAEAFATGTTANATLIQDAYRDNTFGSGASADDGFMIAFKDKLGDGTTIVNYIGDITSSGAGGAEAALKFSLPAHTGTLTGAALKLKVVDVVGSPTVTVTLTEDNNWEQTNDFATSTFPTVKNPAILANSLSVATSGLKTIDLQTNALSTKINLTQASTISLILTGTTVQDNYFNFVAADDPSSVDRASLELTFAEPAPAVSTVTVPANGTYKTGDALDFTVVYDKDVTVTGIPRIPVTLGTGGTAYASYVSGSGGKNLLFRYTVAAGDMDTDGIALGNMIELNSGAIRTQEGISAALNLSPAATGGIRIDGVSPTISSVTVPPDAVYYTGDSLEYTVNFSEKVTVDTIGGTPYLTLTVGNSSVHAEYSSGSGENALTFRYVLTSNDTDSDGVTLSSPITLNGGTIQDHAGNNAAVILTGGTAPGVLVTNIPERPVLTVTTPATDTTAVLTATAGKGAKSYTLTETNSKIAPQNSSNGIFSLTDLIPNTAYSFTATVHDDAGHTSNASDACNFVTAKQSLADAEVTLNKASFIYTGNMQTPVITVKKGTITLNTDQYLVSYKDSTDTETVSPTGVGTYKVLVTASSTGNYMGGAISQPVFTITPDTLIEIKYRSNDESFGTVSTVSESVAQNTGMAVGSTAVPAGTDYGFANWTNSKDTEVSKEFKFVPAKNAGGVYEAETYTANFVKKPVIVIFVPVTGMEAVPANTVAGRNLSLHGTVLPDNATNKSLTWKIRDAGSTGARIESGNILKTTAAGVVMVEATVNNGSSETTDYTQSFSIIVSPASTALFEEIQELDTLTAGQKVIYASASNASGSNAEMDYFDFGGVIDMDATPSDAKFRDKVEAGLEYTVKSWTDTVRRITYTIWHVFKIEENNADDSRYVFLVHNPVWMVSFNANGGSSGIYSMYTDENGYLNTQPEAARSGYSFNGWYTNPTDGDLVTNETVFDENSTVYAHWIKNSETPINPVTPVTPEVPSPKTNAGDSGGTGSSNTYTGNGGNVSGSWTGEKGQNGTRWQFKQTDGTLVKNTWIKTGNAWYRFDKNGYAQTGWLLDHGKWYHCDAASCAMNTGLYHDEADGRDYYMNGDGSMVTGWVEVNGKWSYFNTNPADATYSYDPITQTWVWNGINTLPYGAMLKNTTTPDGHTVDENGVRTD